MNSSGISAIIFDLDGVLVNGESWHEDAFSRAMADLGYNVDRDFKRAGNTTLSRLKALRKMGRAPSNIEEINERKQKYTVELIKKNCQPIERVVKAVEFASEFTSGKIAVATNSSKQTAHLMLETAGLANYFDVVITNEDVDGKVKPHPLPYLMASYKMNVFYKECLAIDDSSVGIMSAIEAGCKTLRVRSFDSLTDTLIRNELTNLEIRI